MVRSPILKLTRLLLGSADKLRPVGRQGAPGITSVLTLGSNNKMRPVVREGTPGITSVQCYLTFAFAPMVTMSSTPHAFEVQLG